MFEGFKQDKKEVNGVIINYRIGGSGPGLLLLHGHPQTHFLWHKVAGELAKHFTVVASDLRGYGDSGKPEADPEHKNYSKVEMARDQAELMRSLGFEKYRVLAHDRGARVAHRLGMDDPAVERMVLLDIAPTLAMYSQTTEGFARAYWHWFFLIQKAPMPETALYQNPELYVQGVMGNRSAGLKPFHPEALAEYKRCLSDPGTARGICEDYRASASIDMADHKADLDAGRKLKCPILVLWGKDGAIEKFFDPISEWKMVAEDVSGHALQCGHYIAEECPELLLKETLPFLTA